MERVERDEAGAGEIISIAGIKGGGVNVTLLSADERTWPDGVPQPLPVRPFPPSLPLHPH
jgi:predicted membrane GTPase involved in stress response